MSFACHPYAAPLGKTPPSHSQPDQLNPVKPLAGWRQEAAGRVFQGGEDIPSPKKGLDSP